MIETIAIVAGAVMLALSVYKPKARGSVVTATTRPLASLIPARIIEATPALAAAFQSAPTPPPVRSATATASTGGGKAAFSLTTPARTVAGVTLTLPNDKNGIDITHDGHSVRGVRFTGGSYAIKIGGGATNITVDDYGSLNPFKYGLYLTAGDHKAHNQNLSFKNISIALLTQGSHCVRIYFARNVTLENVELTHHAPYKGHTLNIRQASGLIGRKIRTYGKPPVIGPNPADGIESAENQCEDLVFENCTFDMDFQFIFYGGCRRIKFINCTFIRRGGGEILNFGGVGAFANMQAITDISFDYCTFSGGTKLYAGSSTAATFNNSTWNGKTV